MRVDDGHRMIGVGRSKGMTDRPGRPDLIDKLKVESSILPTVAGDDRWLRREPFVATPTRINL